MSHMKGCRKPVSKMPWCLTAVVRRTMDRYHRRTASRNTGAAAFLYHIPSPVCVFVCRCIMYCPETIQHLLEPVQCAEYVHNSYFVTHTEKHLAFKMISVRVRIQCRKLPLWERETWLCLSVLPMWTYLSACPKSSEQTNRFLLYVAFSKSF